MKFSNKSLSQTITQLCLAKAVDHIVISPGSRNAALITGFVGDDNFKKFSIVDERCAAFFALGIAQQLKQPVVLVCTSGSALLNYFPAIAEAFYSDIPLIVISADRPAHLIEIGDSQTIQQENVYGNHVLYSANCIEGEEHQTHNETEINIAINTAIELNGPVHINAPFSEPLYRTVETLTVHPQNVPARTIDKKSILSAEILKPLANQWNNAHRKIILAGVVPPESIEQHLLDELAKDDSVIVLTETTSNLHHPDFFPAIDQLIAPLTEAEFKDLQPDILLTFGGMIISKKIKAFLRNYSPTVHWHIDDKKAYDTYFNLKEHIKIDINSFLKEFLPLTNKLKGDYNPQWLDIKNKRLEKHEQYVNRIPYSDFSVFAQIFKQLPQNIQLQLSNSATIRYAQLFNFDASVHIFCNRGTSGIDGSTTTAIGAAYASKLQTIFITGDLSFFYDSNALWNNYIPQNFKIIVVNNGGGGIFRILPEAKFSDKFEEFFETKHNMTAKQLCEQFGFEYHTANNTISVKEQLTSFFNISEGPKLLEIFTPSMVNDEVLLDYFKFIK